MTLSLFQSCLEIMGRNCWLVKQEPEDYSWDRFAAEGQTAWTGVRNFQARNFMGEMEKGDPVLYYHSGTEKQVIGIARVKRPAYADPTVQPDEARGNWCCVDLQPVQKLAHPVTLAQIKADLRLQNLLLVRQARLSVMPIGQAEFKHLLKLSQTKYEAD